MSKKNSNHLIMAGALVVLVILYLILQRSDSTRTFDSAFFQVDSAAIRKVRIETPARTIELTRENGRWMVDNYPASASHIKRMLGSLSDIRVGRFVSDKPARHAAFELTDGTAMKVTVSHHGQDETVYLGKQGASFSSVFIRKDGEDDVYATTENFKSNLDYDAFGWKDKAITRFASDDIQSLVVKQNGVNAYVIQNKDSMIVIYGENPKTQPEVKGNSKVTSMMSTFTMLNTTAFPDSLPTVTAAADITINPVGGSAVTLSLFPEGDNRYVVRKSDTKTLFAVSKIMMQDFLLNYDQLKQ